MERILNNTSLQDCRLMSLSTGSSTGTACPTHRRSRMQSVMWRQTGGGGDNQDVDERKGLDKFTTLFVMMVHKRQQPSFFAFVGKFGICCFL